MTEDSCNPPRRKRQSLSPAQDWALAVSGQNDRLNDEAHDQLHYEHSRECMRTRLESWWSVTDADSCRAICQQLMAGMHQRGYQRVRDQVVGKDKAQLKSLIADMEPQSRARAKRIWKESASVESAWAWDLVRVINVARMGYTAGFFSESYAWWWVLRAARELQARFDSVGALAASYWAGFRYWWWDPEGEHPNRLDEERAARDWLLKDPQSPWRELKWNTPLPAEEPEPENRPKKHSKKKRKRAAPAPKPEGHRGKVIWLVVIAVLIGAGRIAKRARRASKSLSHHRGDFGDRASEDRRGGADARKERERERALLLEPAKKLLAHKDADQRAIGAELLEQLEQLGEPAGATLLIEALKDVSPKVRRAAAKALGTLKASTATAALQACAKDPDSSVREAAQTALAKIKRAASKSR